MIRYSGSYDRNYFWVGTTCTRDLSSTFSAIDDSTEIPAWESRPVPKEKYWKIPVRSLSGYRDLLVPFLLTDYGVDDLEDSPDEYEEDPLADGDDFDKVGNWLSGNYGQCHDHVPTIVDKTAVFITENTELQGISELGKSAPGQNVCGSWIMGAHFSSFSHQVL